VGLLEKSLKKAGKDREKASQAVEKRSVGWLRTSLGERTSALADKIDLEEQYARLETLASAAPAPPKPSLRDRARRLLGLVSPAKPAAAHAAREQLPPAPAERPRMTLRQRAAMLMKRMGGHGSGGDQGSEAGSPSGGEGHGPAGGAGTELSQEQESDLELPHPVFFPWLAISEEGALQSKISFGEDNAPLPETGKAQAAAQQQELEASKAPLAEFADTIGRITENLKNLHIQLDKGNFIRDIQVEQRRSATQPQTPQAALISHHVPVDAAVPLASAETINQPAAQGAAPAKDIFWPRNLPLDLPARDIRINADGSVSVVPGPLQLPYLADDIAPPESELSHFTRSLKNAELFITEGELTLTRIIYERLLKQIVDEEARRKIRANLEALDNYRKSHDWGNFMPIPPWLRNPWQEMKPPQVSLSEMPVEASNISIHLDKGFFEIARALFELKDTLLEKKAAGKVEEQEEAAAQGSADQQERRSGEDRRKGLPDPRGEGAPERRSGAGRRATDREQEESAAQGSADQQERRSGEDRRKGLPDPRGEGAPERRSGKDRRAAAEEENAAPPPLAAEDSTPEMPAQAEPEAEPPADGVLEPPQIPQMAPDGTAQSGAVGAGEDEGDGKEKEEENKVQEIRGVLELKTPDQEDTPFLTLTYDFTKIPHAYRLAKDNGIFEYAYYKYKPMLVKAHQFIKRKQITRALNYYRVIREQQIPPEFRRMVDRNIKDITEYLQKYLLTRQN
jgi:hypothetical protein